MEFKIPRFFDLKLISDLALPTLLIGCFLIASSLVSISAHADYQHRFSLGVGFATTNDPSQTSFEIGGEYEYREEPWLGLGLAANYIFSDPSVTYVAAPDVFLHPFEGDFLISAAPLVKFGPGRSTNLGARVGTRIPIPVGTVTIIPTLAVDFIDSERDYIFGLGLQL